MKIGNRSIGLDHPPLVIAEVSGNHDGSLDKALEIVDAIAAAGGEAVKLQTYTADTMTLDVDMPGFKIEDPASPWAGYGLHELYAKAHTPWEWHEPLFARARSHGMLAFSSPFDATAVAFLDDLDVPCMKIASFENTDHPLIAAAAATGRPMIISTGLATLAEIDAAVQVARDAGCTDLAVLKCTSDYPSSPTDSHVRTVAHLREAFGCEVGLSDHTLGIGAAIASVALGGTIIEKHVTLRREDGGVDSGFSLEPAELALLIDESTRAWQSLGEIRYGHTEAEAASLVYRRSLYVVADVAAGDVLSLDNVRAIRPGFGDSPANLDRYLGAKVARDVPRGTPLTRDLLREE